MSVTVLDVNDNVPVFSPAGPLKATVAEFASKDFVVASGRASDRDKGTNAALSYKLLGGSPPEDIGKMLSVTKGASSADWQIKVANGSLIDFDKYRSLTAIVEAEDGEKKRKSIISV